MGGTILEPDKIRPDITFRIRLGADGDPHLETLRRGSHETTVPVVNFFAGSRDDPFLRGPRIERNVASIALEVPLAAVSTRQDTLLIWATSKVGNFDGLYQDLVGRPLRSMVPENAERNLLRPRRQEARMGVPPEEMMDNTTLPAAFPSGRRGGPDRRRARVGE